MAEQGALLRSGSGDQQSSGRTRPWLLSRPLPSGRAVLGGLLIAIAGIGVLVAYQRASNPPETNYLVAVRDVAPGTSISEADLGRAALDLVDVTAAAAFTDPDDLVGRTALAAIAEGDLIQHSAVGIDVASAADGPARKLTLDLEPAAALGGSLVDGQLVDVVASGDTPGSTSVIVRSALVLQVGGTEDPGLGGAQSIATTLAVRSDDEAAAIIDAHRSGKLTLITSTRVAPPPEPSGDDD